MKIVADQDIPLVEELFSALGDIDRYDGRLMAAPLVAPADVLIVRSITTVDEKILRGSRVKFVGTVTSGIDHINTRFLDDNGIGFGSAAGCNARAVAEYVLSSLFVLVQQFDYELSGRSAAIIGCGHVGSMVREFLETIGLDVLLNDPPLKTVTGSSRYRDLDDIFAADIITLHVPLERSGPYPTVQMINDGLLERLKKDVILINTARGEVVDERALLTFLAANPRAHAVIDVWTGEPRINMDLLSRAALGTAHIAGYSQDSKHRAVISIYEQVCNYFGADYDRSISAGYLDPVVAEIPITGQAAGLDAVQLAVLTSYDIRTDSSALRQMLAVDPPLRAGYFDELRNNYRSRREFSAMRIKLPAGSGDLADKLTGLGFIISMDK